MAEKVPYKKGKKVEEGEIKGWTAKIEPKSPFFLFVPSSEELPEKVKEEHEGQWFALGDFYDTKEEAMEAVKKAGYTGEKVRTLKRQSYVEKLDEVL